MGPDLPEEPVHQLVKVGLPLLRDMGALPKLKAQRAQDLVALGDQLPLGMQSALSAHPGGQLRVVRPLLKAHQGMRLHAASEADALLSCCGACRSTGSSCSVHSAVVCRP